MSEPCCIAAAHDQKCTCSAWDELATAYGLLWHMFIDRRDRNLLAASTARTHLSNALTKEQKQRGIALARERIQRMGHDPDAMLRDPDVQAAAAALWEKTDPVPHLGDRQMTNPEGFSPALEEICRERCAEFGDPPCWRLPELVEPCEHITPCEECLAEAKET